MNGLTGGENRWDNDKERIFLRCEPEVETSECSGVPWEDGNWNDA